MAIPYVFTSERLGFRNWLKSDIPKLAAINSNPRVMEFFPAMPTPLQTREFVIRMQKQYAEKGFCYFAVDTLHEDEFIGFIGLSEQTFAAEFTPCIDIGWRLSSQFWHKGYATEGAKRCLAYGLKELQLNKIYALAPKINLNSERVMQKAGMRKVSEFTHPLLARHELLKTCVLYLAESKG